MNTDHELFHHRFIINTLNTLGIIGQKRSHDLA